MQTIDVSIKLRRVRWSGSTYVQFNGTEQILKLYWFLLQIGRIWLNRTAKGFLLCVLPGLLNEKSTRNKAYTLVVNRPLNANPVRLNGYLLRQRICWKKQLCLRLKKCVRGVSRVSEMTYPLSSNRRLKIVNYATVASDTGRRPDMRTED